MSLKQKPRQDLPSVGKIESEKDMRRGRFAFPHLRDFYNQNQGRDIV